VGAAYGIFEDNVQHGRDLGYDVNIPADDGVQLDIDDPMDLFVLEEQLKILRQHYSIKEKRRTVSPGGNTHVYLRFQNPLTAAERIALQAALGSDRKRELLSLIRHFNGEDTPTVLYERPKPTTYPRGGYDPSIIENEEIPF
jgi:hypothetical protein